tara:strand:+ start:851 stop:991 length:141 start_codon:yes stop_codon:yes gene_type:complete
MSHPMRYARRMMKMKTCEATSGKKLEKNALTLLTKLKKGATLRYND